MSRIRKFGMAALAALPLLGGTFVYANAARAGGPSGSDTCLYGYVWRDAGPGDHVCVTPTTRRQAAADNAAHPSRVDPSGGAYGPDTCLEGYVWRDAFAGDQICVPPATRSQAAADNAAAGGRRALDTFATSMKISDGSGVYGDAQLFLNPNGALTYKVHLDNSNGVARQTATVCAVKLLSGDALIFQVKGDIAGKIKFWDSSKRDWLREGTDQQVIDRWAQIGRGAQTTCRVSTSVDGGQLTKQILKGVGLVAAAVVIIVAAA
jgi:hypothetical protein